VHVVDLIFVFSRFCWVGQSFLKSWICVQAQPKGVKGDNRTIGSPLKKSGLWVVRGEMRDTRFSTCSIRYPDTTVQLTHRSEGIIRLFDRNNRNAWVIVKKCVQWDKLGVESSSFLSLAGLGLFMIVMKVRSEGQTALWLMCGA
jgi:hypothetical protein